MIITFIVYLLTPNLDKYTITSFLIASFVSICYYFIEPLRDENDVTIIIKNFLLTLIPSTISMFIYVSIDTFPYIILKYISKSTYHATTVSFMSIFETFGKNIASIITILQMRATTKFIQNDKTTNENSFINLYGLITPLCFVAFMCSFIFIYYQKHYLNQKFYVNKEQRKAFRYTLYFKNSYKQVGNEMDTEDSSLPNNDSLDYEAQNNYNKNGN